MLIDVSPFKIMNIACHGCQEETMSSGDTHEQEIRQMLLCISVSSFQRVCCLNVNAWIKRLLL